MQLAREALDATPDNLELRSRLAVYLVKSGEREAALADLAVVERADTPSAPNLFRALIVYELAGDRARALVALKQALRAGYSAVEIPAEPELIDLRTDPQFHVIMNRAGQPGG